MVDDGLVEVGALAGRCVLYLASRGGHYRAGVKPDDPRATRHTTHQTHANMQTHMRRHRQTQTHTNTVHKMEPLHILRTKIILFQL